MRAGAVAAEEEERRQARGPAVRPVREVDRADDVGAAARVALVEQEAGDHRVAAVAVPAGEQHAGRGRRRRRRGWCGRTAGRPRWSACARARRTSARTAAGPARGCARRCGRRRRWAPGPRPSRRRRSTTTSRRTDRRSRRGRRCGGGSRRWGRGCAWWRRAGDRGSASRLGRARSSSRSDPATSTSGPAMRPPPPSSLVDQRVNRGGTTSTLRLLSLRWKMTGA